jgi:hypothetical protein
MAIDRRGGSGSIIEQPAPALSSLPSGQSEGMLLPVMVMRCSRCGAQAAVNVPPTPVFRLPNGLLLMPDHEGKARNPFPTGSAEEPAPLENPVFVLFLPRPSIPCPQCSSTSLLIPSGGMPPLPPRAAH